MTFLWLVIAVEVAIWGGLSAVGCYVETKRLRRRRATRPARPAPVLSTDDRIAQLILDGRLEVAALNPDGTFIYQLTRRPYDWQVDG